MRYIWQMFVLMLPGILLMGLALCLFDTPSQPVQFAPPRTYGAQR